MSDAIIGQWSAEEQKRIAEAEEVARIEERAADIQRHVDADPRDWIEQTDRRDMEAAHADRARLLVLLREALLREATLRADLREARARPVDREALGRVLWARRHIGSAFPVRWEDADPALREVYCADAEAVAAALRPAGTLASLPAEEGYRGPEIALAAQREVFGEPKMPSAEERARMFDRLASLDDACDGSDR